MNMQTGNQTQSSAAVGIKTSIMEEQDLVKTVLADEKRTIKEYASAITEAECQTVRETFTQIFNDTLQIQGEVYQLMSQQGWYGTPDQATSSQVQKEITKHKQTAQQTTQWMQQQGITVQSSSSASTSRVPSIGPNGQLQ